MENPTHANLLLQFIKELRIKSKTFKKMFTLTVFEILLFEGRSVMSPAQRGTGNEKFLVKNQKNIGFLLKLFKR